MIEPNETVITGAWSTSNGRATADENCRRIEDLTQRFLVELGRDASGWHVLYRDPIDNRYWELAYPDGEMQGGGPPQLHCLSRVEAAVKYGEGACTDSADEAE